jgi:hypothetical protein
LSAQPFDIGEGSLGVGVGSSGCVGGHQGAPVVRGIWLREAQN